jgi:DNA-directed RNA polymerase subunit M/transcription elongation factor TFIIS
MDFYKCCNCGYNNNKKNEDININKIKINNDKNNNIKEVKVNKEIIDIIIFL